MVLTLSGEQRNGTSVGTGTTGTTNAVNVVFRVVRVVIVQHMGDVANVLKVKVSIKSWSDQNDDQGMIA